jgi:Spy/CpxP family protein refolding chaperone
MKFGKIGLTCATLFLLSAVSLAAFAQDNGQAAAPAAGARQGRGQGGYQRGGTLATLPVSLMDSYLKLTSDQKSKITAIQTQYKADVKALMPAPADAGAPADPQARRDMMQKSREVSTKADADIKAVLTPEQTPMLDTMNKDLQTYNAVGIPAEILGEVKLTADQKAKITTIADDSRKEMQSKMQELQNGGDRQAMMQAMQGMQKATHDKAMEALDLSQKNKVELYLKDHPQPQGGRGGFGGGRRPGAGAPPRN